MSGCESKLLDLFSASPRVARWKLCVCREREDAECRQTLKMHWKLFRGRQLRHQREEHRGLERRRRGWWWWWWWTNLHLSLWLLGQLHQETESWNDASRMRIKQQKNRLLSMFSFMNHRLIWKMEEAPMWVQQNQLSIAKILFFLFISNLNMVTTEGWAFLFFSQWPSSQTFWIMNDIWDHARTCDEPTLNIYSLMEARAHISHINERQMSRSDARGCEEVRGPRARVCKY